MVVHLLNRTEDNKVPSWNLVKGEWYRMTACGFQRKNVTTDKNKVTCKRCLKKINLNNE